MGFPVHQRYLDCIGVGDDVVIREDVAALGINDDTGTGTNGFACPTGHVGSAKKPPERVVTKRVSLRNRMGDADVHDGRRGPLDKGRQAGHSLTVHDGRHLCGCSCRYGE